MKNAMKKLFVAAIAMVVAVIVIIMNAVSIDNELEIKISEDIYIKILSPNNNKLKDLKIS